MPTFDNREAMSSVRAKINAAIQKVDGLIGSTPESLGYTGTSLAADTAVMQAWAAASGVKSLSAGVSYRINGTLSFTGAQDIDFNGGKLVMASAVQACDFYNAPLGPYALMADYVPGATELEVAELPAAPAPGTKIKIISDAIDPANRDQGSNASQYRLAQWAVVGFGSTTTQIVLQRPLRWHTGIDPIPAAGDEARVPAYTTALSARVILLQPGKLSLRGANVEYETGLSPTTSAVNVAGYDSPAINGVTVLRGYTGLALATYGAVVNGVSTTDCSRYHVSDTGHGTRLYGLIATRGRHAYTTGESTAVAGTTNLRTILASGRVVGAVISGVARGFADVAPWDTHHGADDVTFDNCLAEDCSAAGFNARGRNIRFVNPTWRNCAAGVSVLTEYNGGDPDDDFYTAGTDIDDLTSCIIENPSGDSTGIPITVSSATARVIGRCEVRSAGHIMATVSGRLTMDCSGFFTTTDMDGRNAYVPTDDRGIYETTDPPAKLLGAFGNRTSLTFLQGQSMTHDVRSTTSTSVRAVIASTNSRVLIAGLLDVDLPNASFALLTGDGEILTEGVGRISYSLAGADDSTLITNRTGRDLRIVSKDGQFSVARLRNEPYSTRAAMLASALTPGQRVVSCYVGGLLLDYVPDALGTAAEMADGATLSPAGIAYPEHFGDGHAALVAWAAYGGGLKAQAGEVYASAARTAPIIFPAGAAADFQGATFQQDWTLNSNDAVFALQAGSRVENLTWHITGSNFHQRGASLYEGAQVVGWKIEADTPFPDTDDNFDGGLIVRGPDVLIEGCDFHGHATPIRMYDGEDQSRCKIVNCNIWDYKTAISLRGGGMVGGVIDGLYLYGLHPGADTVAGQNVVNGSAPFGLVRNVKQMFDGKGSGEHFLYSAAVDGTEGMRFEGCSSNGSGQCFFKARGHDGLQLTDMHGGPTSIGNTPGTNEDGFRFEYCRNVKARDLSVRSDAVNPSGYDGIHINNCWDMDFAGLRFGRCQRAYVRIINPSAGLVDYTYPPNLGPENITIDGLFARGATTQPLLSIGAGSGDTAALVGDITIRNVDWDGDITNLVVVADDSGTPLTLNQMAGTAIRISGVTDGVAFNYVWAAGSTPVYTTASPDGGMTLRTVGNFVNTDGDNAPLRIGSNTATASQGDLGQGVCFLKPGSGRPWAAVVGIQSSTDTDQGGIAFFVHDSSRTSDTLAHRMTLLHTGTLEFLAPGVGVRLKSPDGLTTRTLTIDNSGALVVS